MNELNNFIPFAIKTSISQQTSRFRDELRYLRKNFYQLINRDDLNSLPFMQCLCSRHAVLFLSHNNIYSRIMSDIIFTVINILNNLIFLPEVQQLTFSYHYLVGRD